MRVLVTGATGYIGSAVVGALLRAGHDVHAFVRRTDSPRAQALEGDGATLVTGGVAEAIAAVDAVAHTAWDATDPVAFDLDLLHRLRDAQRDGRARHLLSTSGCSIYGEHRHAVLTESTPVDGSTPRAVIEGDPVWADLHWTVLRPGMVHGGDSRSSIVGRWFERAAAGDLVLPGDRTKRWSWVDVDDVARAYAAVLDDPEQHRGATYLLAEPEAPPVADVVAAAAAVAGVPGPVPSAPADAEDEQYRVFDRDEIIDAALAEQRLGWVPASRVLADLPAEFTRWSAARA